MALDSSNHRHKTIGKHLKANTMQRIKEILSDESDEKFPIFISGSKKPEVVKTVACGNILSMMKLCMTEIVAVRFVSLCHRNF